MPELFTAKGLVILDTSRAERQAANFVRRVEQKSIQLSLSPRGFTQPLGRITGAVAQFTSSMEAANARVLAFGASVGIIYGAQRAFTAFIKAGIDVEKQLTDINVILNASTETLSKFGESLFDIARNTGKSFAEVSTAATELARQGLTMEETLKRTRDSLILTRLAGLDAASSVEAITAAINSFKTAALDSTVVINKFAAVDAKFAVSSADLAEAIKRSASSAEDAGVSFEQLLGLVTAVQQTTARGGSVIGNALKTIFSRLQRTDTIDQLKALGVQIDETQGGVDKLKAIANALDRVDVGTSSKIKQAIGGVYQINIVSAALKDLTKQSGIFDQAFATASSNANTALERNLALNRTVSAEINRTIVNLTQVGAKAGQIGISPIIKTVLNEFNTAIEGFDSESVGATIGRGIARGLGNFLTGPGFILLGLTFAKLFKQVGTFAVQSLQTISGLNRGFENQRLIQKSVVDLIGREGELLTGIRNGTIGVAQAQQSVINKLGEDVALRERILSISRATAQSAVAGGYRVKKDPSTGESFIIRKTKSKGLIPNLADEGAQVAETIGAIEGGYVPGEVKPMNVKGIGQIYYNTAETVKTFPQFEQPAIMPPKSSEAGQDYQKAFEKTHGFDPYRSEGFIPNFAQPKSYAYHVTTQDRSAEIAQDKLRTFKPWYGTDQSAWPDGSTRKRAYFSLGQPHTKFQPEGQLAILRTPVTKAFKTESTGDLYIKKPLDSKRLQIQSGEDWISLKKHFNIPTSSGLIPNFTGGRYLPSKSQPIRAMDILHNSGLFSPKQRQVMALISDGIAVNDVASKLNLNPKEVESIRDVVSRQVKQMFGDIKKGKISLENKGLIPNYALSFGALRKAVKLAKQKNTEITRHDLQPYATNIGGPIPKINIPKGTSSEIILHEIGHVLNPFISGNYIQPEMKANMAARGILLEHKNLKDIKTYETFATEQIKNYKIDHLLRSVLFQIPKSSDKEFFSANRDPSNIPARTLEDLKKTNAIESGNLRKLIKISGPKKVQNYIKQLKSRNSFYKDTLGSPAYNSPVYGSNNGLIPNFSQLGLNRFSDMNTAFSGIKKPVAPISPNDYEDLVNYLGSNKSGQLNKDIKMGGLAGAMPFGRKKEGSLARLLKMRGFNFGKSRGLIPNYAFQAGSNIAREQLINRNEYGNAGAEGLVKELLQNAVDSIERAAAAKTTSKYISEMMIEPKKIASFDTGEGMTPQLILEKFLPAYESGKTAASSRGGFGAAKSILLGTADKFLVNTIAKTVGGRTIAARLSGTPENYFEFQQKGFDSGSKTFEELFAPKKGSLDIHGMKLSWREVKPTSQTYAKISLSMLGKREFEPGQAPTNLYHSAAMYKVSANTTPLKFYRTSTPPSTLTRSSKEKNILQGGLQSKLTRSADVITANTGESQLESKKMAEKTVPGGLIRVFYNPLKTTETKTVPITNNGLLQTRLEMPSSAKIPAGFFIDVKSDVDATDPLYPWKKDRKSLREDAHSWVNDTINNLSAQVSADENRLLSNLLPSSKEFGKSGLKLVDLSTVLPESITKPMLENPELQTLTEIIRKRMNKIKKVMAERESTFSNTELGGLSIGNIFDSNFYGAFVGESKPNSPSKIFFDPLNITQHVDTQKKAIEGVRAPMSSQEQSELYSQLYGEKIGGTLVHELAHQTEQRHFEGFSSRHTILSGILAEEQAKLKSDIIQKVKGKELFDFLSGTRLKVEDFLDQSPEAQERVKTILTGLGSGKITSRGLIPNFKINTSKLPSTIGASKLETFLKTQAQGKFFRIKGYKYTDNARNRKEELVGKTTDFTARMGVSKGVTGAGLPYDRRDYGKYGLMGTYAIQRSPIDNKRKLGFKNIYPENVQTIVLAGKKIGIDPNSSKGLIPNFTQTYVPNIDIQREQKLADSKIDQNLNKGLVPNYALPLAEVLKKKTRIMGAGKYGIFSDYQRKKSGIPIGAKQFKDKITLETLSGRTVSKDPREALKREFEMSKILEGTPLPSILHTPKTIGTLKRSLKRGNRIGKEVISGKTLTEVQADTSQDMRHILSTTEFYAYDALKKQKILPRDLRDDNLMVNTQMADYLFNKAWSPKFQGWAEKVSLAGRETQHQAISPSNKELFKQRDKLMKGLGERGHRINLIDPGLFEKVGSPLPVNFIKSSQAFSNKGFVPNYAWNMGQFTNNPELKIAAEYIKGRYPRVSNLPRDVDFFNLSGDTNTRTVTGGYNFGTGRMKVAVNPAFGSTDYVRTMAHELRHAIQHKRTPPDKLSELKDQSKTKLQKMESDFLPPKLFEDLYKQLPLEAPAYKTEKSVVLGFLDRKLGIGRFRKNKGLIPNYSRFNENDVINVLKNQGLVSPTPVEMPLGQRNLAQSKVAQVIAAKFDKKSPDEVLGDPTFTTTFGKYVKQIQYSNKGLIPNFGIDFTKLIGKKFRNENLQLKGYITPTIKGTPEALRGEARITIFSDADEKSLRPLGHEILGKEFEKSYFRGNWTEYKNKGLIPNFASSPLIDAIQREKSAGVPLSQIRVGSHPSLRSSGLNPSGLGVFNTIDEPKGLSQGINRIKSMGLNPKLAGTFNKGEIPNFAIKGADVSFQEEKIAGSASVEHITAPKRKAILAQYTQIEKSLKIGNAGLKEINKFIDALGKDFNVTDSSVQLINQSLQATLTDIKNRKAVQPKTVTSAIRAEAKNREVRRQAAEARGIPAPKPGPNAIEYPFMPETAQVPLEAETMIAKESKILKKEKQVQKINAAALAYTQNLLHPVAGRPPGGPPPIPPFIHPEAEQDINQEKINLKKEQIKAATQMYLINPPPPPPAFVSPQITKLRNRPKTEVKVKDLASQTDVKLREKTFTPLKLKKTPSAFSRALAGSGLNEILTKDSRLGEFLTKERSFSDLAGKKPTDYSKFSEEDLVKKTQGDFLYNRKALKELSKRSPETAARIKAEKAGSFQNKALGISFLAPMVAGMAQEFITPDTKGKRATQAALGGIGNAAGFAAIGAMVGGTKFGVPGAAAGGAIGIGAGLYNMYKEYRTSLPEMTKNLELVIESTSRMSQSLSNVNTIFNELSGNADNLSESQKKLYGIQLKQNLASISAANPKLGKEIKVAMDSNNFKDLESILGMNQLIQLNKKNAEELKVNFQKAIEKPKTKEVNPEILASGMASLISPTGKSYLGELTPANKKLLESVKFQKSVSVKTETRMPHDWILGRERRQIVEQNIELPEANKEALKNFAARSFPPEVALTNMQYIDAMSKTKDGTLKLKEYVDRLKGTYGISDEAQKKIIKAQEDEYNFRRKSLIELDKLTVQLMSAFETQQIAQMGARTRGGLEIDQQKTLAGPENEYLANQIDFAKNIHDAETERLKEIDTSKGKLINEFLGGSREFAKVTSRDLAGGTEAFKSSQRLGVALSSLAKDAKDGIGIGVLRQKLEDLESTEDFKNLTAFGKGSSALREVFDKMGITLNSTDSDMTKSNYQFSEMVDTAKKLLSLSDENVSLLNKRKMIEMDINSALESRLESINFVAEQENNLNTLKFQIEAQTMNQSEKIVEERKNQFQSIKAQFNVRRKSKETNVESELNKITANEQTRTLLSNAGINEPLGIGNIEDQKTKIKEKVKSNLSLRTVANFLGPEYTEETIKDIDNQNKHLADLLKNINIILKDYYNNQKNTNAAERERYNGLLEAALAQDESLTAVNKDIILENKLNSEMNRRLDAIKIATDTEIELTDLRSQFEVLGMNALEKVTEARNAQAQKIKINTNSIIKASRTEFQGTFQKETKNKKTQTLLQGLGINPETIQPEETQKYVDILNNNIAMTSGKLSELQSSLDSVPENEELKRNISKLIDTNTKLIFVRNLLLTLEGKRVETENSAIESGQNQIRASDILTEATMKNAEANLRFADELKATQIDKLLGKVRQNPDYEINMEDVKVIGQGAFRYERPDYQRDLIGLFDDTFTGLKTGFASAFSEILKGTKDVQEAFKDMFTNILGNILDRSMNMFIGSIFNKLSPTLFGSQQGLLTKNKGGLIKKYAGGGTVMGGSGTRDDVLSMLSAGEYVVRKKAVNQYGTNLMDSINSGSASTILDNKFEYIGPIQTDPYTHIKDVLRPTAGKFVVSPKLSTYGQTDDFNPQNEIKFGREQSLFSYMADKIAYDQQYKEMVEEAAKQQKSALIQAYASAAIQAVSYGINSPRLTSLPNKALAQNVNQNTYLSPYLRNIGNPATSFNMNTKYAKGGYSSDTIPALLTGGEYIMNRGSVNKYGVNFMNQLNAGKFAMGGPVGDSPIQTVGGGATDMLDAILEMVGLMKNLNNAMSNKPNNTATNPSANTAGSIINNVTIGITINKDGTTSTSTTADSQGKSSDTTDLESAKRLTDIIKPIVIQEMVQQQKVGGVLYTQNSRR